jgi:Holliday junction resolvase RusA-like endonuclease
MLIVCLSTQLVSTVSGFTHTVGTEGTGSKMSTLVRQYQSTVDMEYVSDSTTERTTRQGKASKGSPKEEAIDIPWHWMEDSDPVVIERHDFQTHTGPPERKVKKVSRVGFKVRGNPRPLRRHRTSRGHMYNPSLKYQNSFQDVVEKLLFSRKGETSIDQAFPLAAPIFSAEESLVMTIIFRMKRPKNHFVNNKPGPERLKHGAPPQTSTIRTDVDNLTKFVLDSMNQVLYEDDRQIMSIHVTKLLDNDGVCGGSTEVYLRSIEEMDVDHILGTSVALTQK